MSISTASPSINLRANRGRERDTPAIAAEIDQRSAAFHERREEDEWVREISAQLEAFFAPAPVVLQTLIETV
jgi:hypothetical protein